METPISGYPHDHTLMVDRAHPFERSDSDTLTGQSGNLEDESRDTLGVAKSRSHRNSIAVEEEDHVRQLARQYTTQSHAHQGNPFEAEVDGPLDPNGPNFNARAWTRAFFDLHWSDSENALPTRTTSIAFKNINVHGYGTDTDYQKTVGNVFLEAVSIIKGLVGAKERRVQILQGFEGVLHRGEMLCVLGPPGSGCSTLLRTIAGETHGFYVDENSYINYQGITPKKMHSNYRGETVYTAEVDNHFPHLSVHDTLYFAALARSPRTIPGGVSREVFAKHVTDVVATMLGISHTMNTRVGDDYVRGVSGGERKRVSIAEASLSGAPLQCWDNSTRGLDSANAVEFCRTLRTSADIFESTALVAIYQAPQEAYDLFDKVIVLYEGRQIFFGTTTEAKFYFEDLGFVCPERQTTPDFLTSMTSPEERIIRPGYLNRVPNSPEDFAKAWLASSYRDALISNLENYNETYAFKGEHAQNFQVQRRAEQSKIQRERSPYTLSYFRQCKLCMWRGYRRLVGDPTVTIFQLVANFIQMLVISSVFYNLPSNAESMYRRAIVIFFGITINALASILEMYTLYAQCPIIEKHDRYALYHPSADAVASMIVDLPYKILNAIVTNATLYFMANLRREPGPFFFYLLLSFTITLTMSMLFRFIASATRTLDQSLAPASIMLLALMLYTGFAIPPNYMLGWAKWIKYINPVSYAYESLLINEFAERNFPCSSLVPNGPGYVDTPIEEKTCPFIGSSPGSAFVNGSAHLLESYDYMASHKWRNFAIVIAFMTGLMLLYLITGEIVSSKRSKGEVLVFKRGYTPSALSSKSKDDIENGKRNNAVTNKPANRKTEVKVQRQNAVFHWRNICYDVKIKTEERRILNYVDGWVKPGTLTALMGVSGAGKTTLLDVLASRITTGVVSGDIFVDSLPRDVSFQRKTGYVQQQDLHLSTSTVREALEFSALLRQPSSVSHQEKLEYVDEVIDLLEMQEYADAVVGHLGEGLNVEQRKRLTIGVELAAKPQLLLFLDEPTSGLDSQTSWSICNLMRKLVDNGQAILCTIHQPSAMLFQRFDRLLLLAKGGRTVYFGDIGKNSQMLIDYFVTNGAEPCPVGANPAEWMLRVIGAAAGSKTDIDWPTTWRNSSEFKNVHEEIDRLQYQHGGNNKTKSINDEKVEDFAASLTEQTFQVSKRVFQQYWRAPSYIYSKALLTIGSTLFIGFSFFKASNTQRGLQNQMFGIFIFLTIFFTLVEQIIPLFVTQRTLYEARERPSKTYSWKAFLIANIVVEIPWNTLMGILCFLCWWYPIGLYSNASHTDAEHSRAFLAVLFVWMMMLMASTFAHLMISGVSHGEVAANLGNVLAMFMLIFCGILAGPQDLPQFWIFMYRVNPFTYLVEGLLGTGLANAPVKCAPNEYLRFQAPNGTTCGEYMQRYIAIHGGYLENPAATECSFCTYDTTNAFLQSVNVSFSNRWRDFGILWAFVIFNVIGAVLLYWLARVPKKTRAKQA